ncbi:MAG: 30S ribosomal protein S8 [Deferribacteres bacterium]|nr:30S ribosomal protein S8 [candidate division KSB1 bacterium]MCB9511371.1 30S ribosomal protein S8 [Deferribacteres bacterium]
MSMTDPISDMLTRIRNAGDAGHRKVDIPASRIKKDITKLLMTNGFIKDYILIRDGKQGIIRIYLKFDAGKNVINGLKKISKPGQRKYVGAKDIPRVYNNIGVAIMSTSRGIMTNREARELRVGGEVLCYVW